MRDLFDLDVESDHATLLRVLSGHERLLRAEMEARLRAEVERDVLRRIVESMTGRVTSDIAEMTCQTCTKPFVAARRNARYCPACRAARDRNRRDAWRADQKKLRSVRAA